LKQKLFKIKFGIANITSIERLNRCNRGYILHWLSLAIDVVCLTRCAWWKLGKIWDKIRKYYIGYFNNRCNRGDITSVIEITDVIFPVLTLFVSVFPSLVCVRVSSLKLLCLHWLHFCAWSCFACLRWLHWLHSSIAFTISCGATFSSH